MPNELNIAAVSGLSVTAQRYQSGAAVGSPISLSEIGSSGFYTGNMTGSAGTYQLAFISSGTNIGIGSIVWSGTAEIPASTFNAASDTVARVTLVDTATTLTNSPSVASIATATRQEMDSNSTKLANLDATVSSRLATSGYTAPSTPPTVAAIRQEMDANSTQFAAIKAKTDALNTTRLSAVATESITLSQLTNALSQ